MEKALRHRSIIKDVILKYGQHKLLTSVEIQDLINKYYGFNLSDRMIRHHLRKMELPTVISGHQSNHPDNFINFSDLILMIDDLAPNLNNPLKLTGDRIISSDWHIPSFSIKWFNVLMAKAKQHNIKKLDIAGDFINLDLLSKFYEKNPDTKTPTVNQELEVCKMVIEEINSWFDEIFYSIGNHEKNRFMRAMHNGVKINELIELMTKSKKWHGCDLPYYYVDDIRVTHPKTYRQTKLSTAIALSYKYGCPVLQAHGHFLSLGYNASGQIVGDTGGLMDWERTKYLFESGDTTHPKWNNGFLVYKNKKIIPYGEGIGE